VSTMPDPAVDADELRYFLRGLKADVVREMAAGPGMRYRHESTKPEIIEFLVRYAPQNVRDARTAARATEA
jgi:hypothetical protein